MNKTKLYRVYILTAEPREQFTVTVTVQLINRRSSKTKPTAHPEGATQLYQVVR